MQGCRKKHFQHAIPASGIDHETYVFGKWAETRNIRIWWIIPVKSL